MCIHTSHAVDRLFRTLIVTTIIRVLVFPIPIASAAMPMLVAPLGTTVILGDGGRVVETDGLQLATVAGNALISPAMPVTVSSELPAHRTVSTVRRRAVSFAPVGATFRVVVTAYSSTPDQTDASPFVTASGTTVHPGTIAVNFLPFGTRVKFPVYSGDAIYVVEDRMAKRFSDRADIWFTSRSAAYAFGKRTLTMVVVE